MSRYVADGCRVVNQTLVSAQPMKPEVFSIVRFVIWFILAILPAVYNAVVKKDDQVYLTVDERGHAPQICRAT